MRTIILHQLPDFMLIRMAMANEGKDKFFGLLIDYELEARYEAIKEELEPYVNEDSS